MPLTRVTRLSLAFAGTSVGPQDLAGRLVDAINAGEPQPFTALFHPEGVVWADAYAWGYYELAVWLEAQAAVHLHLTFVSPVEPDPLGVHWWADAERDDWRAHGAAALRVWQVLIPVTDDASLVQQFTSEPRDKAQAAALGYAWPPRSSPTPPGRALAPRPVATRLPPDAPIRPELGWAVGPLATAAVAGVAWCLLRWRARTPAANPTPLNSRLAQLNRRMRE